MKKRIIAIVFTVLLAVSAFSVSANAYSAKKVCNSCGTTCYRIRCLKRQQRSNKTSIPCVLHSNCSIDRQTLYYDNADSPCNCTFYKKYGYINNSHVHYATHKAVGTVYVCMEDN